MEDESAKFGAAQLSGFLAELVERDRLALAARLERASGRLAELGAGVPDEAPPRTDGWNSKEVLAHVAVLSKFYGVVAYRIGSGAMTELDLGAEVAKRDSAGRSAALLPAAELVARARADHARTLDWLRTADAASLRRSCDLGAGRSMTAEEVARLPLCAHLEQHLEQLERALGGY